MTFSNDLVLLYFKLKIIRKCKNVAEGGVLCYLKSILAAVFTSVLPSPSSLFVSCIARLYLGGHQIYPLCPDTLLNYPVSVSYLSE